MSRRRWWVICEPSPILPGASFLPIFPLIPLDQLPKAMPELTWLLSVEIAREAATIVMLVSVALVAGGRASWLPSFAIAFGTWDIFYYVFLKLLLHWPASIMTWDILFLVPVPWAAPVLAPVVVSVTIIGAGLQIGRA